MPELVTKADLLATEQRLLASIRASQTELRAGGSQLDAFLELQILRLTVRFGVMLAVWVVVAAIILKRV
jgi:hypothetical protein